MSTAAVCFVTKYPHSALLKFAQEVSDVGFEVFVVSDDESSDKNVYWVADSICNVLGYRNAHIWENSGSIKKQITAWDKMLYLFCEIETRYDFVWVFEDDCFIPSVETIQHLHLKYQNAHLVTPNNFKNDGSQMDWHWRWIYDKCKNGPYAYSMVSACGLSRDMLNEVKRFVQRELQLFFIEAMFNTLALQKGLKVVEAFELKSVVWQGEWGINEFLLLPNNIFHPRKDIENHIALREMTKEYRLRGIQPKNNLPHFLQNKSNNMIIRDIKDIMMCCGENCEIKETCFRYIHHWDAYSQVSLFPESPFTMHKGKQFCPKFIDPKEVKYERNESNT